MVTPLRAVLRVDTSQFETALADLSRALQGPPKRIHPGAGLFTCDYCAGMSNGLSCVHCGAPRREATRA